MVSREKRDSEVEEEGKEEEKCPTIVPHRAPSCPSYYRPPAILYRESVLAGREGGGKGTISSES